MWPVFRHHPLTSDFRQDELGRTKRSIGLRKIPNETFDKDTLFEMLKSFCKNKALIGAGTGGKDEGTSTAQHGLIQVYLGRRHNPRCVPADCPGAAGARLLCAQRPRNPADGRSLSREGQDQACAVPQPLGVVRVGRGVERQGQELAKVQECCQEAQARRRGRRRRHFLDAVSPHTRCRRPSS